MRIKLIQTDRWTEELGLKLNQILDIKNITEGAWDCYNIPREYCNIVSDTYPDNSRFGVYKHFFEVLPEGPKNYIGKDWGKLKEKYIFK